MSKRKSKNEITKLLVFIKHHFPKVIHNELYKLHQTTVTQFAEKKEQYTNIMNAIIELKKVNKPKHKEFMVLVKKILVENPTQQDLQAHMQFIRQIPSFLQEREDKVKAKTQRQQKAQQKREQKQVAEATSPRDLYLVRKKKLAMEYKREKELFSIVDSKLVHQEAIVANIKSHNKNKVTRLKKHHMMKEKIYTKKEENLVTAKAFLKDYSKLRKATLLNIEDADETEKIELRELLKTIEKDKVRYDATVRRHEGWLAQFGRWAKDTLLPVRIDYEDMVREELNALGGAK